MYISKEFRLSGISSQPSSSKTKFNTYIQYLIRTILLISSRISYCRRTFQDYNDSYLCFAFINRDHKTLLRHDSNSLKRIRSPVLYKKLTSINFNLKISDELFTAMVRFSIIFEIKNERSYMWCK